MRYMQRIVAAGNLFDESSRTVLPIDIQIATHFH